MSDNTNRQIVVYLIEISQGDKRSLSLLYQALSPELIKIALKYSRNMQDAAEILQETFLTLIQKAHTYRGGNAVSFVKKICRNKSIDFFRSAKRREKELTIDLFHENAAESFANLSAAVGKIDLTKALEGLSEDERQIIICLYYQDLSFKETAKKLGLKRDTLYKRHANIVLRLRQRLE